MSCVMLFMKGKAPFGLLACCNSTIPHLALSFIPFLSCPTCIVVLHHLATVVVVSVTCIQFDYQEFCTSCYEDHFLSALGACPVFSRRRYRFLYRVMLLFFPRKASIVISLVIAILDADYSSDPYNYTGYSTYTGRYSGNLFNSRAGSGSCLEPVQIVC